MFRIDNILFFHIWIASEKWNWTRLKWKVKPNTTPVRRISVRVHCISTSVSQRCQLESRKKTNIFIEQMYGFFSLSDNLNALTSMNMHGVRTSNHNHFLYFIPKINVVNECSIECWKIEFGSIVKMNTIQKLKGIKCPRENSQKYLVNELKFISIMKFSWKRNNVNRSFHGFNCQEIILTEWLFWHRKDSSFSAELSFWTPI